MTVAEVNSRLQDIWYKFVPKYFLLEENTPHNKVIQESGIKISVKKFVALHKHFARKKIVYSKKKANKFNTGELCKKIIRYSSVTEHQHIEPNTKHGLIGE